MNILVKFENNSTNACGVSGVARQTDEQTGDVPW